MRANFDVVEFAFANGLHHYKGVPSVETACHVCDVDERKDFGVGPAFQIAVALAQVDIEQCFVRNGTHGWS